MKSQFNSPPSAFTNKMSESSQVHSNLNSHPQHHVQAAYVAAESSGVGRKDSLTEQQAAAFVLVNGKPEASTVQHQQSQRN